MPKLTFEQWMKTVNGYLLQFCSMTSDDLPDCCYRDWYEDKVSPKTAASRALKNAEN